MSGRQNNPSPSEIYPSGNQHYAQSDAFSGRSVTQSAVVQRSLMEIFDEFTEVISGELKSMSFEDYENPQHLKD